MLLIVFGLPGSGKSFFASAWSKALKCGYLNTDMLRKKHNASPDYSMQARVKLYEEILQHTEEILKNKHDLIVDGTFLKQQLRDRFENIAAECNAQIKFIEIKAQENTIRERVSHG